MSDAQLVPPILPAPLLVAPWRRRRDVLGTLAHQPAEQFPLESVGIGGGEPSGRPRLVDLLQLPSDSGRVVEFTFSLVAKHLGNAGIGGRVTVTFTVQVNGRATGCRVSRSSGVPELDALTCRLIEQRFRFRPSTDRFGRPIPDEVDWDHDWVANRAR